MQRPLGTALAVGVSLHMDENRLLTPSFLLHSLTSLAFAPQCVAERGALCPAKPCSEGMAWDSLSWAGPQDQQALVLRF